jgi:hypothetical protein
MISWNRNLATAGAFRCISSWLSKELIKEPMFRTDCRNRSDTGTWRHPPNLSGARKAAIHVSTGVGQEKGSAALPFHVILPAEMVAHVTLLIG